MRKSRFGERADHWHPEGAPSRDGDQGVMPHAWDWHPRILQVALEIWRHGRVCGQAAEGLGRLRTPMDPN